MSAALRDEVVAFVADDGRPANLIHVTGAAGPTRGPVVVVHGAGVRANIFRAPVETTVIDALVDDGFDVWMENWRASIDLPPSRWTLDEAARFDHPAAVRTVAKRTRSDQVKALIHCQGSTSFMMSATAGLLPQVTTIVSNAVSLHPVVPTAARWKSELFHRPLGAVTRYLDPRWALDPPDLIAAALVAWVRLVHHECNNPVCRFASFTYGVGGPTMWTHPMLNDATHQWLDDEFGAVPLSFFHQMNRCLRAGHLVSVAGFAELPATFGTGPVCTDADIVLLAGAENRCFLPESQERTADYLQRNGRGRYDLHVVDGYGHLDMFMGQHAATDVFPLILAALED